jgi:hypothetical protein
MTTFGRNLGEVRSFGADFPSKPASQRCTETTHGAKTPYRSCPAACVFSGSPVRFRVRMGAESSELIFVKTSDMLGYLGRASGFGASEDKRQVRHPTMDSPQVLPDPHADRVCEEFVLKMLFLLFCQLILMYGRCPLRRWPTANVRTRCVRSSLRPFHQPAEGDTGAGSPCHVASIRIARVCTGERQGHVSLHEICERSLVLYFLALSQYDSDSPLWCARAVPSTLVSPGCSPPQSRRICPHPDHEKLPPCPDRFALRAQRVSFKPVGCPHPT